VMAKEPADKPLHPWEVSHIQCKPALVILHVEASDAESAIDEVMRRFRLKAHVRDRLEARRAK
jgi:hypothetical protein